MNILPKSQITLSAFNTGNILTGNIIAVKSPKISQYVVLSRVDNKRVYFLETRHVIHNYMIESVTFSSLSALRKAIK